MFHKLFDLNGLEKEIQEYRGKVDDNEPFIPEDWVPGNFKKEDLRKVLIKAVESNKKFEEFMPDKFKEHLKSYNEGIKKGYIY
ncbi:MAG: hypothetical protein Q4B43_05500 [Bacteroidota bacterium]|nr:hypothetical protein [Bacteroidota bacterium]